MASPTLLSNLQLSNVNQSVCVKLICKGKIETGSRFKKTPLVLGDEKGITIQATYFEDLNESNEIALNEGECYEIKHFKVTHAEGLTRLTRNRYHIKLSNSSLITKIQPISYVNYYDFASYKIVRRGLSHPKFSIDLYGALVGVGDIQYFLHDVNGGMPVIVNRKIQFSLINMQFTQIKCVAYGSIAQQIHDFWTATDAFVVLCVLQFWGIDWGEEFDGFKNVTTIDGFSKILFDPEDVQEIQSFRMRIPNTAF